MVSNKYIQTAKIGYIILSTIFCILGIALIAVPDFSISLLCWIGGAILILFGMIKIIGYLSKDLYRLAFQYDLACGILLIALGVILIIRSDTMINIVCVILGVYILADALLKIQISIDAKMFGIHFWWLILSVAVLTGIIGFLLVFRPLESAQVIMILLGIALFTEGILNLITILTAVKIMRNKQPDVIDAEIYKEYEEN